MFPFSHTSYWEFVIIFWAPEFKNGKYLLSYMPMTVRAFTSALA